MNVVEIVVRTKDDASAQLKGTERTARDSGGKAGRGFSDAFSKGLGGGGGGGLFSGMFGRNSSLTSDAERAGRDSGASFLKGFKSALGGGKSGGGLDVLNAGGVAGGALPGMLGVSGKHATMLGLGGAALGALPAIVAAHAAIGVAGIGGQIIAAGAQRLIGQKNTAADPNAQGPLFQQAQAIQKSFQAAMKGAAGAMLGPLKQAFNAIPGLIKSIGPGLKAVFSGAGSMIMPLVTGLGSLAKSVLPLLGQALRAVGPLLAPLLTGLGTLLKGILPGLVTLLKAAHPAISAFASILGMLGKGIGGMLSSFGPALKASSVIFQALGGVIAALFPIVGKLATTLATALAPTFAVLAGVIKGLLPAITPLVNILASFGGAVLGDLVGVLGSVGTLLKGIAPSFTTLAKAASQVFTAFENNGVFAILGNALEGLAGPLANLINALVKGLAPALPGIIAAFSRVAAVITVGLVTVVAALATALTAIVKAIPPSMLTLLANGFVAVYTAVKLWSAAQVVLNLLLTANPVGVVIVAVAALAAGLIIAWQKSALFRDIIKDIAKVALQFGIIVLEANKAVVNAFLWMAGTVVHAAASAFGWIPGIGPKIRGAATEFDTFRSRVNGSFDAMIGKMHQWQDALDGSRAKANTATQIINGDFGKTLLATDATTRGVNNIATAIGNLHSKNLQINMNGKGQYSLSEINTSTGKQKQAAAGLYVAGGVHGRDSVLINAMPGEVVVPTHMVNSGAVDHLRGRIPGFSGGGVVGNLSGGYVSGMYGDFQNKMTTVMLAMMRHSLSAAEAAAKAAAAKAAASSSVSGAGPVGGDAGANKALARKIFPWPASQWDAFNTLEMHEAGYNRFARNPSSGAYGIPQALPPTKMPFAAQAAGGSHAGPQLSWMFNYIRQIYGTPGNAWARYYQHPGGVGWYGSGGATSAGWAMVGEHGRELIKVPGGSTVYPHGAANSMLAAGSGGGPTLVQLEVTSGGSSDFERFMATWIKQYVRVKGGGSAQAAFGSGSR